MENNSLRSSSLSPIIERHSPQHPLPEEIQKMGHDETVCQFCGVSYLIHHEMKKLQEHVRSLESELLECRGSVEREGRLKDELSKNKEALTQSQNIILEKDDIINKLTFEIDRQSNKLSLFEKENIAVKEKQELLKRSYKSFKENIHQRLVSVKQQKDNLSESVKGIKLSVQESNIETQNYRKFMVEKLNNLLNATLHDIKMMDAENEQIKRSLERSKFQNIEFENQIVDFRNKVDILKQNSNSENNKLLNENENLKLTNTRLENKAKQQQSEVQNSLAQIRTLNSEVLQMKEVLNQKNNDLQNAIYKLNKSEQNADQTIQRMNQEIRHMERDLVEANKERDKYMRIEEQRKQRDHELSSKFNEKSGELQQIKETLEMKKEECFALQNEREQIVMYHQNQISQLRESFQEKLDTAQGNPMLFKKEISELKQRHEDELNTLERRLKENFKIEITLQKEKNEEYIASVFEKHKDEMNQLKENFHYEMKTHMNEASIVRQQLDASKHSFTLERQEHKQECDSLKRMILQLEAKVTEAVSHQVEQNVLDRNEFQNVKEKFELKEEENEKLQKLISELQEEVTLLQETVRRECEERFELTEALSDVRDQLLHLKAHSNGLGRSMSTPRLPVSVLPSNGDNGSIQLSKKTLKSLGEPRSPVPHGELSSPHSSPIRNNSSHLKDISFNSTKPQKTFIKQSNLDPSVESARKRIAAAIKKR